MVPAVSLVRTSGAALEGAPVTATGEPTGLIVGPAKLNTDTELEPWFATTSRSGVTTIWFCDPFAGKLPPHAVRNTRKMEAKQTPSRVLNVNLGLPELTVLRLYDLAAGLPVTGVSRRLAHCHRSPTE
jgi:hypothetical protein